MNTPCLRAPCVTLFLLITAPAGAAAQTGQVYTADDAHSIMDFTTRLLGFNRVRGTFAVWRASVYYEPDAPQHSSVSFLADAASISTGAAERDGDLKRESFFDVTHFPRLRFQSTGVEPAAHGFVVTGNLTIRDSTHRIQLPVQIIAPLSTDPFGNQRVSFGTGITLNRRDFGVVGPAFWAGAIADSFTVEIEIGSRLWNYSQLSWSEPPRRSAGELLFTAADSGRLAAGQLRVRSLWANRGTDTTWDFSAWQFEIAAMRLAQRRQLSPALAILDLGVDLHQGARPKELARLLMLRGEVQLQLGHRTEATADFRQATRLDPDSTDAIEWLRHTGT